MAFLGVKEILDLQAKSNIVDPFEFKRIKNAAYELSLGSEVYLTDSKTGKVETINADSNRQVDINPGQFALLLTKEKVSIPKDKIAFISIKAGEKLKGLINVSGFHVDPGFSDHLLFSVYNAGPSIIVLNFGEPYFPIWFAEIKNELSEEEAYNEDNAHFNKLGHIPSKYIEFLKRGELTSPKALLDKINVVNERNERNDWFFKILIGIAIAVCLKLAFDWLAYERGYEEGRKTAKLSTEIHKTITDSMIVSKIDSILAKSDQNDALKNR